MAEREHHRRHHPKHDHEPPTLPLPSTWRLIVAAVAIVAFLYLMYRTGEKDAATNPSQSQSSAIHFVLADATIAA